MAKLSINKNLFTDVLKGLLLSIIIGVILILIFGIIVRFVPIEKNVLIGVNQAIKVLSIFLGCFLGFKEKKFGLLKGAIVGILYTLSINLIFGIIEKNINFNVSTLIELGLGLTIGIISGIIAVNIKRKKLA